MESITDNPIVSKALAPEGWEMVRDSASWDVRLKALRTRKFEDAEFERMLGEGGEEVAWELVRNPHVSPVILNKIYNMNIERLNLDLCLHPNLTPALFYKLSASCTYRILERLVRRADCPVEIVDAAGNPQDPRLNNRNGYYDMAKKWRKESGENYRHFARNRIYRAVAQNPNVSKAKVLEIIQAPYMKPRILLAKRQDLPSDIYRKLLEIDELPVVINLASNPGFPSGLLKVLEPRRNPKIIAGLLKNPNISSRYVNSKIRHNSLYIRTLVASHSKINTKSVLALLEGGEVEVLEALAANPHVPPSILAKIAREQRKLRLVIARNPNADSETLTYLFREVDFYLAPAVISNPNCPEKLLLEYSQKHPLAYAQLKRLPLKFQIRYLNWLAKQKALRAEYQKALEQYAIAQMYQGAQLNQIAKLPIDTLFRHILSLEDGVILKNQYFLELLLRSLSPNEQVMFLNLEGSAKIKELYSLVKLASSANELTAKKSLILDTEMSSLATGR